MTYMNYMVEAHNRLQTARRILWQVGQALAYLEDMQVAHRDIKPENIVVVVAAVDHNCSSTKNEHDSTVVVKLCDFGWAVRCQPAGHRQSTLCGTAEYVPPEMLRVRSQMLHATKQRTFYAAEYVDRWMLGVLTVELVHGSTPFGPTESESVSHSDDDTDSDNDPVDGIFAKIRCFSTIPYQDSDPDDYRDFVSKLLQVRPLDRCSALQAVAHSFLVPCVPPQPRPLESALVAPLSYPSVAQRRQLFESAGLERQY